MVLRVLPVVYLLGIVMLGSLSLSAAVAPRTLYFHNLCTYPVRLGSTGGNTGLPCGGQGDCPDGTWCGDGHCYFTLPEPAGGFDMAPGATREIKLNGPVKTQTGQVQVRATPLLCSVWTIPNCLYARYVCVLWCAGVVRRRLRVDRLRLDTRLQHRCVQP